MEATTSSFDPVKYNAAVMEQLQARDFLPSVPFIQLCGKCNLKCAMCPADFWETNSGLMPFDLFQHVLNELSRAGIGTLGFASAQGEPFLHPDVFPFLEEAIGRGFKVIVSTNGTVLNESRIQRLACLRLLQIQFSFFGYDKESYETTYRGARFEHVVKNLVLLKESLAKSDNKTELLVNGVSPTGDAASVRRTYEFLNKLGISENEILAVLPCNFGGKITAGRYHESHNTHSFKNLNGLPLVLCSVLAETPGIYYDGKVTACGCLDCNRELLIGDITCESISEIRNGPRFRYLLDCFLHNRIDDIPLCSKCDVPYGPERLIRIKPDPARNESSQENAMEKHGMSSSGDSGAERILSAEVKK